VIECGCESSVLAIKCKAYGGTKNSTEKIRFFDDRMNFEFAFQKILVCGGSYGIFERFHLLKLMEKYRETKRVEFLESCKAMSKNHHLIMSEQEIKVGQAEFEDQLNFERRKRGLEMAALRAESLELLKGAPSVVPLCRGRHCE
jgi:hypothetical protein